MSSDDVTTTAIEIDAAGLWVEGTRVPMPFPVAVLTAHWGAPVRRDGKYGSVVTWHDRGTYAHLLDDDDVKSLSVQFLPEARGPAYVPHSPFTGTLRIDGTIVTDAVPGAGPPSGGPVSNTKSTVHGLHLYASFDADDALESVSISREVDETSTVPRDKYTDRPARVTSLMFSDLNLKLAVVDELMYQQKVIEPVFSIAEFARWYEARSIDLEAESGSPIPEALAWFERLPIDASLAERVRSLVFDAGNAIYQQVAPQWDGEDDLFDVRSWADLDLLPRLEHLDFVSLTPDAATVRALRARGLKVDA